MPDIKEFKLPDVGEGLTEGEIVRWMVQPGDTVTINQNIVEVETAKVTVELPSPYAGLVTALLFEEGVTVDVGAPIIQIDIDPNGEAPAAPAAAPAAPAAAPAAAPVREQPYQGAVPSGDATSPDESEKMLVGYGPRATVAKRRARSTDSPPAPAYSTPKPDHQPLHAAGMDPAHAVRRAETPAVAEKPRAKPPIRKYAKDAGIDLFACVPTGPQGTVIRADVDRAVAARAARGRTAAPAVDAPVAEAPVEAAAPAYSFDPSTREQRIPIKGVRKATAAAMVSSAFTAPHVTEWLTIDVTPMMKLRERMAANREYAGVKLSPLVFVAKAILLASGKHPMINAFWDEVAQEIVVKDYVNLGIAAATPRGLLVPNIKDAGRLSLIELARAISSLTEVARSGKTAAADMAGGTITITNVGVFGVDTGTPILNPGESAILAFGAIRAQPWVHKGKVKPRQVTTLGLSFDHRVVDGELGSRFLADVGALLADPGMALAY